jgi:hypothetical protein
MAGCHAGDVPCRNFGVKSRRDGGKSLKSSLQKLLNHAASGFATGRTVRRTSDPSQPTSRIEGLGATQEVNSEPTKESNHDGHVEQYNGIR